MKKIQYSAMNSGGDWWLTDADWDNLEKAGWTVDWSSAFLGAKAMYATKEFESIDDAKDEFSRITSQDPDDEGCPCCGQPHYFGEI